MLQFVNRLMVVRWDVEEHLGTAPGNVVETIATNSYTGYFEALKAMCEAKARGNGVTCIARNRLGEGTVCILGIDKA